MSQHHQRLKHTSKAAVIRPIIAARLPARCVECPHVVTRDQRWQVAHIRDAMDGGDTTIRNTGPAHTFCPQCQRRCNQSAGGKRGAAKVNARKQAEKNLPAW